MNFCELKKLKSATNIGSIFKQIHRLTIKNYSSLSNINISFCIKFPIPIMHRHFFKIISQNPEYVERVCNDRNNPFHFSIRNWMINQ